MADRAAIIDKCKRASYQIAYVNLAAGAEIADSGGAGVAVFRDSSSPNDVYLATAAHVVDLDWYKPNATRPGKLIVIDSKNRRYTDVQLVVMDKANDLAILRVRGLPSKAPVVGAFAENVKEGDPVFAIGWPLQVDCLSVSSGTVRSSTWSGIGIVADGAPQVAVDAPILPGNSGGGVFTSKGGQLVGLVSWGFAMSETFVFLVSASSVRRAMLAIQYEARPRPWPIAWNSYCFGAITQQLTMFEFERFAPSHPALEKVGRAGMMVVGKWLGMPVAASSIRDPEFYYKRDEDSGQDMIVGIKSADIVWAIALPPASAQDEPEWHLIQEDQPFTDLVAALERKRRVPGRVVSDLKWRSSVSGVPLDVARPATAKFPVLMLVSGIVDGAKDATVRTVTVDLRPRSDLVASVLPSPGAVYDVLDSGVPLASHGPEMMSASSAVRLSIADRITRQSPWAPQSRTA